MEKITDIGSVPKVRHPDINSEAGKRLRATLMQLQKLAADGMKSTYHQRDCRCGINEKAVQADFARWLNLLPVLSLHFANLLEMFVEPDAVRVMLEEAGNTHQFWAMLHAACKQAVMLRITREDVNRALSTLSPQLY